MRMKSLPVPDKDAAAVKYGEPPYGHAELPASPPAGLGNLNLADICREYGLNVKAVVRGLTENIITADLKDKMKKVAEKHRTTPFDLFEMMK